MSNLPLPPPAASLVVPTRNRRENLRECLLAAGRQTVPLELIVVDDGSDDGTAEMMREEFPQALYQRFEGEPQGPSFIRNYGSRMAHAAILFPLDDDALLVSPHTVEQTLTEFDSPRIGAVGIPFVNIRQNDTVLQRAPDDRRTYVCSAYVGASHALRRDVFLALGGYREELFYMGEEGDYCLRMLAAGYVTRLGRADPIHHHESPRRASWRMDYYGRRNDVLFAWHNVPARNFPVHLAGTVFNGLRAAANNAQNPGRMLLGTLAGGVNCLWQWRQRQPVPRNIYNLSRRLKKRGLQGLQVVEKELPPPQSTSGEPCGV